MIREFIDTAFLEDFVAGLSRSTGLAIGIYGSQGGALALSEPASDYARRARLLAEFPAPTDPTDASGGRRPTRLAGLYSDPRGTDCRRADLPAYGVGGLDRRR